MTNLASFAMSSMFVSLVATGCGDNGAELTEAQLQFPASCLEAGGGLEPASGAQTLYVGNDALQPWKAMCIEGDEFLVTDSSSYGAITDAQGDLLMTEFRYLRIDPASLAIDLTDTRFANTTGTPKDLGNGVVAREVPAGVAISCAGANGAAHSLLAITETPFRITTTFELSATATGGHVGVHRDGRWIETWVEGSCGSIAPAGVTGMPIDLEKEHAMIALAYAGPEVP